MPIDPLLPDVAATARQRGAVVLRAPPGAGKTTRVPVALLDAAGVRNASAPEAPGTASPGARQQTIIMLEPRRLAARAAARWIARERGSKVGAEIGYQVRFDKRVSTATRLLVVTEGILLRRLQRDPFLDDIGVVIFDEFHERRADSDLLLAMVRRVQQEARPDLQIVVMSATLAESETAAIASYLGNVPVLESDGRHFPVDTHYLDRIDDRRIPDKVADAVVTMLPTTAGDLLAFLPGVGEIERTAAQLRGRQVDIDIVPLYGTLHADQQDAALQPGNRQRVVLATNVAETSVTVPGITAVIDSGMVRRTQWDLNNGMEQLVLTETSQASADQRAGRAGRTAPGTALRLWTERQHSQRASYAAPEIARTDLTAVALQLLSWGERDLSQFPWFEAPPASHVAHAIGLLELLGAIDAHQHVTDLGHALLQIPSHPCVARFLIAASEIAPVHRERVALLAALLEERDPFRSEVRGAVTTSDLLDRLQLAENHARRRDLQGIFRARDQLLGALGEARPAPEQDSTGAGSDAALLQALVLGFPHRLARRRANDPRRAVLASGRGVRLSDRSRVHDEGELLLCHDVHGERDGELLVHCASAIELAWLPQALITTHKRTVFDTQRDTVVGRQEQRFAGLVVRTTDTGAVDATSAATCLAEAAAGDVYRALPLDNDPCAAFLARLRWLRGQMPELQLPAFNEAELIELLPGICSGQRSFRDLQRLPLHEILQAQLPYPQQQALQREAPEHYVAPSGSRIRLQYEADRAPVLAVRIQEVFGLAESPRLAGGRVPLVLHLLAPNYRPQQVTDDLASFWQGTYFEVRKELRRRYPKHPWPEEPWNARAIRK
ncbi:MAG: ATP-dependent helicase HrpB [Planctomycetota bacterium]